MKWFIPLITVLLVLSCTPELDIQESSFSSLNAEMTSWSNPYRILFESMSGMASLKVDANQKWTVTPVNDRAEWCNVSPSENKKGASTITIRVTENGYDEREAAFVFTCGNLNRTIIVTQKQKDAILISGSNYEVGNDAIQLMIEIKANIDYDISIDSTAQEWIRTIPTKTMNKSHILFDIARNESINRRQGKILVSSGKLQEIINVYQAGETPTIIVSTDSCHVSASGGYTDVQVRSNLKVNMEIPNDCDWIREVKTKTMSTNTYSLIVDPNYTTRPRNSSISFISDNLKESFCISQACYSSDAKSTLFIVFQGSSMAAPVFHGTDISGIIDWGDGCLQSYDSTATHIFSTDVEIIPSFTIYGAETVTIPTITGVRHLDLTQFFKQ